MTDRPAFEPIPGDPAASIIGDVFDATADDWLLTAAGDYHTAAAQTWRNDGTGFQTAVLLQWPARRNHTDELVTVRLMISPVDACGLMSNLLETVEWLVAAGIVTEIRE